MAYVLKLQGQVYRIAANETDKNEQNVLNADVETLSDADFSKVKRSISTIQVSNGNVVITDKPDNTADNPAFQNVEDLKAYHNLIKDGLESFLEVSSNNTKAIYSIAQTYHDTLQGFDYTTLTFPLIPTWEQYCEDNSITYINPLQIP